MTTTVPANMVDADAKLTATATQASTSGTSIDFNSIPAWVKRITMSFSGVSTNGTSVPIVQIGDSGGIENTGYNGSAYNIAGASAANLSSGFNAWTSTWAAASVMHGTVTLTLVDAATNTWAASGLIGLSNSANTVILGGSKALSATLDRIRLTTAGGTDAFDAGLVNVLYE